jgi:hypothetical protein
MKYSCTLLKLVCNSSAKYNVTHKLVLSGNITTCHKCQEYTCRLILQQTLSYLVLQGCRPDLQRNITLQYPKTLAEYFQHAITLSDLPNSHRPQPNVNKPPADSKPKTTSPLVCTHCGKPGHTEDRCFQLHPELRRRRVKASKP